MNIVVVTPSWPQKANPNGIVTYYTNLIPALIDLGHTVDIVTFSSEDPSSNVYVVDSSLSLVERLWCRFKEILEPGYRQYYTGYRSILNTLQYIGRHKTIDIVQMEDSFGWHYEVQKQCAFPVVMRLHGPYFLNNFESEVTPATRERLIREERAFLAGEFITSPSENILSATSEKYGKAWLKSETIPNAMSAFKPSQQWEFTSINRYQILFVGRFDDHKGGDVMLHAFYKILAVIPDAVLIFIGPDKGLDIDGIKVMLPGFMESHQYALTINGRECVKVLGKQDKETIDQYRKQSHITVVASRYETFGNVALEAMACGSPLVCSNAGALSEVVVDEESGLLFENENVQTLSEKMLRLLQSNDDVKRLSVDALSRVKTVYSPAVAASRLVGFFDEAISTSSASKT